MKQSNVSEQAAKSISHFFIYCERSLTCLAFFPKLHDCKKILDLLIGILGHFKYKTSSVNIREPDFEFYNATGKFGMFSEYNVEMRKRVRCITPVKGYFLSMILLNILPNFTEYFSPRVKFINNTLGTSHNL